MKERGVIFTRENRDKSRSGDKTMTRRVIIPQPVLISHEDEGDHIEWGRYQVDIASDLAPFAPYNIGDHLYLQEPYQITSYRVDHGGQFVGKYLDDGASFSVRPLLDEFKKWTKRKNPHMNTSSRFMYKTLARTWFEVVGVEAERLQDISEEDAKAEGCDTEDVRCHDLMGSGNWMNFPLYKAGFITLWDSINEKRGYGWDKNPWVWVVEFKRVEK